MQDSSVYFIVIIILFALNLLIMYSLIAGATKASKRYRTLNAIFYLLASMAKEQGVDQTKIDELKKWAKE
jgi:hypothetical protein